MNYYPEHLTGKSLIDYLVSNKQQIIALKKVNKRKSMPIGLALPNSDKGEFIPVNKTFFKADGEKPAFGEDIEVSAIANLAGYMDYHDDVAVNGSYNRTVNNNKSLMYWLKDHGQHTTNVIARVKDVYVQTVSPKDLGIDSDVKAVDALVFNGILSKYLDEKAYYQYYYEMAMQHSIGLQYVKINLGVNNEEYEDEFRTWQKFYSQIINKERADKTGYAWFIEEMKVFENSHVLFGANEATPQNQPTTPKINEPAIIGTSEQEDSVIKSKFLNNLIQKR